MLVQCVGSLYPEMFQDELLARLQCGECPDTTATLGRTALHAAAANANLAAVAALIEHGADVRIADSNGYTALHMACTRLDQLQTPF